MKGIITAILLAVWSSHATAEIYKCKNEGGDVTFQSSPCDAKEEEVALQQQQKTPQADSSRSKPIAELTVSDLAGTWGADYGGGLKEEWIFTSDGWLTHRNYRGKTIRSQYSFSNGVIMVHHKPALVNAYDEDMTIIRWSGTEMEWRSMFGTTVKAHRK